MKRLARVVNADSPGKALVALDSVSQCLRCSRGEGCGAAIVGHQRSGVQLMVTRSADSRLANGQQIMVEIDEQGSGWLWPVFAAYGLPLLGMLLSTAVSSAWLSRSSVSTISTDSDALAEHLNDGLRHAAELGTASPTAELLIVVSALVGLCGGIFAWRRLAPGVLARAERSLCLQSVRIVAMYPSSEREP